MVMLYGYMANMVILFLQFVNEGEYLLGQLQAHIVAIHHTMCATL